MGHLHRIVNDPAYLKEPILWQSLSYVQVQVRKMEIIDYIKNKMTAEVIRSMA